MAVIRLYSFSIDSLISSVLETKRFAHLLSKQLLVRTILFSLKQVVKCKRLKELLTTINRRNYDSLRSKVLSDDKLVIVEIMT